MSEQIHHSGPMYRPSRDDDQGMDAGTVRLLCLLGGGGLVILVGVLIYSLTGHSGGGAVPVVQADQRPIRVKPENPGGMAVAPQEKLADPNDSRLAPTTEEPNPRALLAITGPAKLPLPPAALAPPHAKSIAVQLQMTKSEAGAQAEWDKLAKQLPDVMGSHRPLFQKTNETGPAPWRLRTSGFADPAQAKAFCDKVKAKGGQCTVVDS
jgi:SPOR domain